MINTIHTYTLNPFLPPFRKLCKFQQIGKQYVLRCAWNTNTETHWYKHTIGMLTWMCGDTYKRYSKSSKRREWKKQCCDLLGTQYSFNVNRANQWIGDEERRSVLIRSFSPILSIKLQGSCHFHLYSITTTVSNLLPLHFNYFHISLRKNTIHEIHIFPSSIFFVTNNYKTWKIHTSPLYSHTVLERHVSSSKIIFLKDNYLKKFQRNPFFNIQQRDENCDQYFFVLCTFSIVITKGHTHNFLLCFTSVDTRRFVQKLEVVSKGREEKLLPFSLLFPVNSSPFSASFPLNLYLFN